MKISNKAIKHGELQVNEMLRDRPAMRKHLIKDDFIWKWAVRKFAGEDLSDTIDWNNRTPYHGAKASHIYPSKTDRGFISIGRKLSFETSWAGAIFELHNIAFCPEFKKVIHKAYKGQIKKKEFILKMASEFFCEFDLKRVA